MRIAVVVNPTKFDDVDTQRDELTRMVEDLGGEPQWLPTTEDDPGAGQTRRALDEGADVVCAYGGDGTVRAVAAVLAGTSTPLGLLPAGTGNLLGRNLQLPMDSLHEALSVAVHGTDRRIDVGVVGFDASAGQGSGPPHEGEEIFLVMTGIGFDADIMATVDDGTKRRLGWAAYAVAAGRHVRGPRFSATLETEDDSTTQNTRAVVIGNCGTLVGGIRLMPRARIDDGILDAVVMSPRGIGGWVSLLLATATRQTKGHPRIVHERSTGMEVHASRPVRTQIDGDPQGSHDRLRARAWHHALAVRVPRPG